MIEIGLDDGALGPPMDVNMMVLGPGCERTFAEYRALLEASGFTNAGEIATPMVVIEAFAS